MIQQSPHQGGSPLHGLANSDHEAPFLLSSLGCPHPSWMPSLNQFARPDRHPVLLFFQVIDECKREKIIPRESVIRSRIEYNLRSDAKKYHSGRFRKPSPEDAISSLRVNLDFERWILVVRRCNIVRMEGIVPQRILWPYHGGKFECADYFRPQERVGGVELQELLTFLDQAKPEIDRGRYGFATYLKRYGPVFLQTMPRGYVVELVQLLLNKNLLIFRKGKIGMAPTRFQSWVNVPHGSGEEGASEETDVQDLALRLLIAPASRPDALYADHDPVSVLERLCAQAASAASVEHFPSFHFEKSGQLHAPLWVCVVTLDLCPSLERCSANCFEPGCVAAQRQAQTLPSVFSTFTRKAPDMFKLKRFKSNLKQKKQDSMQEAALSALESCLYRLMFNAVLVQFTRLQLTSNHVHAPASALASSVAFPPLPSYSSASRGESLVPALMPKSAEPLEISDVLEAADSVICLDRILFLLEQNPAVYMMESAITKTHRGATTMWSCCLNLALKPRYSDAEAIASRLRIPALKAEDAHPKKFDAKAVVARELLLRLRRLQQSYPALFKLKPFSRAGTKLLHGKDDEKVED